jgi:hypothetical protein
MNRSAVVVLTAVWAEIGVITAAHFYNGWFGLLGSPVNGGSLLAGLGLAFLGFIGGPALLVAATIAGIRGARATGAQWVSFAALAGPAVAGAALEAALWAGVGYWPDGAPRPGWQTMLWAAFALVGLTAIAAATRPWRFRVNPRSFGPAWRSAPATCLTFLGALLVLAVCLPAFVGIELANVRSVHSVSAGKDSTIWLARGAYDVDQDPGSGGYPEGPSSVAVIGAQGPVAIRTYSGNAAVDELGSVFLNAGQFAPAETFGITTPGLYRVSLLSPQPDLRVVLVSDPYGRVLTRTAPWAMAIAGALAVLATCLTRLWAVLRPRARAAVTGAGH